MKKKENNYKPLPECLEIKKSKIDGLGLFATKDIKKGSELGLSHIEIDDVIYRTPLGGFYNHSDNPNCAKAEIHHSNYITYYYLISISDIKEGDEITVMYTLYKI